MWSTISVVHLIGHLCEPEGNWFFTSMKNDLESSFLKSRSILWFSVQIQGSLCVLDRKSLDRIIRCIKSHVPVSLSVCLHLSLLLSHTHPLTVFQTVLLTIMASLREVAVCMKHSGWASYLQIRRSTVLGHRPITWLSQITILHCQQNSIRKLGPTWAMPSDLRLNWSSLWENND